MILCYDMLRRHEVFTLKHYAADFWPYAGVARFVATCLHDIADGFFALFVAALRRC